MTSLLATADVAESAELALLLLAIGILIAPFLASKAGLPGLVGLVLYGTLIGPGGLDVVAEGVIEALGAVGLLYLMFQAGVELDLRSFAANRRAAIVFGLGTFAAPFVFGLAEGLWLDYSIAAAILIGSIWASHTLLTYPDVRGAGLAGGRASTTAVSATVITDTLALVVLALVSSISEGGSAGSIVVRLSVGLALVVGWGLFALPWLGRRLYRGIGQARTARFVFLLFGMTSTALLGVAFGIEGIVGAFFAGIGLNRLVPNRGPLMEHVEFFGDVLFVPAFLVYVGTVLDPAVLFQLETLGLAALFLGAVLAGKVLAAQIAGRVLGFDGGERWLIAGMTIPQAAATLAAALVGRSIGLFDDQVINAVVVVVLVSIVIASLLTRWAIARASRVEVATETLGRSVVVCVAGATGRANLMRVAAALAGGDDGSVSPAVVRTDEGAGDVDPQAVAADAAAAGLDTEVVVRHDASVSEGMLRVMSERSASMVLLQREHAPSLEELLLGGDIDEVGAGARVPAMVGRFHEGPLERVVAGVGGNGHDPSDVGLVVEAALRIARHLAVPLVVAVESGASVERLDLVGAEVLQLDRPLIEAAATVMRPGDLLVVSMDLARGGVFGSHGRRVLATAAGVSTLVCAGPGRLVFAPSVMRPSIVAGRSTM